MAEIAFDTQGATDELKDADAKTWLSDALQELADCPAVAVEEGLDKPSELGLTKAEAVLRGISEFVEEQPDIYPIDGGGLAIDLRHPGIESSVLMVIERDGSGVLFNRAAERKVRVRVGNAVDLLEECRFLKIGGTGYR